MPPGGEKGKKKKIWGTCPVVEKGTLSLRRNGKKKKGGSSKCGWEEKKKKIAGDGGTSSIPGQKEKNKTGRPSWKKKKGGG